MSDLFLGDGADAPDDVPLTPEQIAASQDKYDLDVLADWVDADGNTVDPESRNVAN